MKKNYEDYAKRVFARKYHSKNLMPSNFHKLINDNLFEEKIPLKIGASNIFREDSTIFDTTLRINSKEYCINPDVLKEIFNTMEFLIEEINSVTEWDLNEIENNVDARFSSAEKIEYLKEKRKELYLTVQNEPEYYVYTEKREFNGFDNWEDLIYDNFLWDESFIKKYLTEDIGLLDIPKFIFESWHKYYKTKTLIEVCENKINELSEEKKDSSIKNIDLSFQLALLEQIMKVENWDDISANKKGIILTNLLGKNKDNIKNYYNESIKSHLDKNSKFYDKLGKYETDKLNASKLLKEILG